MWLLLLLMVMMTVCCCFFVCAGNIDQAQYCDKIKGIVDFLGSRLSVDELAMIWKIQVGCFAPLCLSCVARYYTLISAN